MFSIMPAESEGESRATWSITGEKTILTKTMGLFTSMDKLLGPNFEKGLSRLKAQTEPPGG